MITGLISDEVPVYRVPGVTGGVAPDINGDRIVWTDARNGNSDVWVFNITNGQETPICTNLAVQYFPRISGDLVVWSDKRNAPDSAYADIYAYDLQNPALGQFPVLLDSGRASCRGEDKVLFSKANAKRSMAKIEGRFVPRGGLSLCVTAEHPNPATNYHK